MSSIVAVKVRCVNRQTTELFDRWYHVDSDTLAAPEQKAVHALTARSPSPSQFLKVRGLMTACDGNKSLPMPIGPSYSVVSFPDHFEDEDGHPLTPVDLAAAMTGIEDPILLNDETSVLRLGPQGVRTTEQIGTDSANTISHFLQLVEVIATSRWVRTETRVGGVGCFTAGGMLQEFCCPTLSDTFAILLPLRQLFLEDGKEAFALACKSYERYAVDDRKRFWITALRKQCNTYMSSRVWPPLLRDCTTKQLLQALMYGAGMIHFHKSYADEKTRFRELVQHHSRELVVFSFVSASQHLYAYARKAYHVIRQDFDYWRCREWCPDPDIMLMSQLFESRPIS